MDGSLKDDILGQKANQKRPSYRFFTPFFRYPNNKAMHKRNDVLELQNQHFAEQ